MGTAALTIPEWRLRSMQWDLRNLGLGSLLESDVGLGVPAPDRLGPKTRAALALYQADLGAPVTGRADPAVLAQLLADRRAREMMVYTAFRGRLGFVLRWEGHRGRPYWPAALSGLTLDPGCDLRFHTAADVRRLYTSLAGDDHRALVLAFGVRGALARELAHDPFIARIRITRDAAAQVLPHLAAPYWRDITTRFPVLLLPNTPGPVQTALLSLAFNRGAHNPALERLRAPLDAGAWSHVSQVIRDMTAHHRDAGLRRRRTAEADIVARIAA